MLTAQVPIPETDRYIKLGTRIPEVPAGQGGELRVVADQQWCRDAAYIIEVRLTERSGVKPVARLSAGPSDCTWKFDGMPVGLYEAMVLTSEHEQIVANGRGILSRGATTLITVESARTEIEGRLTSSRALPSPLRLNFLVAPSNSWTTRVAANGTYHVKIGDVRERTSLAVFAEADGQVPSESSTAFNIFQLTYTLIPTVQGGLIRLDLEDVKLPPVVLHVEVPAVAEAQFDEFAEMSFDGARGPGFKLLRGLRTQGLAEYGTHTIRVLTNDRRRVLAEAGIALAAPETESRVVLKIPKR